MLVEQANGGLDAMNEVALLGVGQALEADTAHPIDDAEVARLGHEYGVINESP
jgi:hypothetical protein